MQIEATSLDGVFIITPHRFGDDRGFFAETWSARTLSDAGLHRDWVQDNHSLSAQMGTLRGLHFQAPPAAQAKLVRCGRGSLYDVAVDIRLGSPTFGQWTGAELSADNGRQLFVPEGFAHGFITLQPDTEVIYKVSGFYAPETEDSVHWASAGIDWPLTGEPILSSKDTNAAPLAELSSPFEWCAT